MQINYNIKNDFATLGAETGRPFDIDIEICLLIGKLPGNFPRSNWRISFSMAKSKNTIHNLYFANDIWSLQFSLL